MERLDGSDANDHPIIRRSSDIDHDVVLSSYLALL